MKKAAKCSDEVNPKYIFQLTDASLLTAIVSGEINAIELAKLELDNRGLDHVTGKWVGFKEGGE